MRRREFIALIGAAGITCSLVVSAQGESTRRIGVFMSFAADDPEANARIAAFHQELERLGWSEPSNLHIDYRFAAAKRPKALVRYT